MIFHGLQITTIKAILVNGEIARILFTAVFWVARVNRYEMLSYKNGLNSSSWCIIQRKLSEKLSQTYGSINSILTNNRLSYVVDWPFNSLPNDKILDQSKLKAFTDDKKKCNPKIEICFEKGRKHREKRSPAVSPFPTFLFKSFLSLGRLKSWLCGKELSEEIKKKNISISVRLRETRRVTCVDHVTLFSDALSSF